MKLKEDNWYKVSIWNNEPLKDFKICELDSRRIYEVTYNKGTNEERKDLIMIFSQVLNYVECTSILTNENFKLVGFVDLYKKGCIKETDYILKRFRKDIIY